MRVALERGHEAIQTKGDHTSADPEPAPVLPQPLPDQPRTADLSHGGENEQQDGTGDRHRRTVIGPLSSHFMPGFRPAAARAAWPSGENLLHWAACGIRYVAMA